MKLHIKVPATTANLSVGFDTAGLALNLYNDFYFDFTLEDGIHFKDDEHNFDTSLTLDVFFDVLKRFKKETPSHITLRTVSNIPVARGLGSSSACVVAAVLAANVFGKLNLEPKELINLASFYEGHPDNVTPAILGNLCLTLNTDPLFIQNFEINKNYELISIIPPYPIQTQKARNILPEHYRLDDIIHTLSRAMFLKEAFTNDQPELLKVVLDDRIHEPYRKNLIKDYEDIKKRIQETKALGFWISGAGPTLMVIAHKNEAPLILKKLQSGLEDHQINILSTTPQGAMIV